MIELSIQDKRLLLSIARRKLEDAFTPSGFDLSEETIPSHLTQEGASFVTLTIAGRLRGCIGALSAYQPLVQDVCEHVLAAAFQDPRFPSLSVKEMEKVEIEISYLTPPEKLDYQSVEELLEKLTPDVDGVILIDGYRRATYLPQVWEQIPQKELFLSSLCQKMGAASNLWQKKHLEVQIYYAIHFSESEFQD